MLLVIVGAVTLVIGVFFADDDLTLVYVSILSCLLAGVFLVIGIIRGRPGKQAVSAPEGQAPSWSGAPPAAESPGWSPREPAGTPPAPGPSPAPAPEPSPEPAPAPAESTPVAPPAGRVQVGSSTGPGEPSAAEPETPADEDLTAPLPAEPAQPAARPSKRLSLR